ncbi:MAG TPA: class I SAM-dependent methyltransferase [Terriglobales bacterium]|nr:class I SAM-dependent methyltransferase [Terriglobales bacterium]
MRLRDRGRNGAPTTAKSGPATRPSGGRGRPGKRTRLLSVFVIFGALAALTRPGRSIGRGLARWLDTRVEGFGGPESAAYARLLVPFLGRLYRRVADDVTVELTSRGRNHKARIVDLGCGTGELIVAISGRLSDARIVGLDSSPSMLLWANRHSTTDGRLSFMTVDAAVMPFADETVDLVVSTLSLHHWEDPANVFAEIARVLKPSGVALIYDPKLVTFTESEMSEIALNAGLEPAEIVREGVRGRLLSRLFVRFRLEGLPEGEG